MGRRTISNLARELKIDRKTIYRKLEELNIASTGDEYSVEEYNFLKNQLKVVKCEYSCSAANLDTSQILSGDFISTIKERLKKAKEQYNYNQSLISSFQNEIQTFIEKHKKTTIETNKGMQTISAITNLEKYSKLNIALSKQISEMEETLDLMSDAEGADPFAG